jgi:hypothetical protein
MTCNLFAQVKSKTARTSPASQSTRLTNSVAPSEYGVLTYIAKERGLASPAQALEAFVHSSAIQDLSNGQFEL